MKFKEYTRSKRVNVFLRSFKQCIPSGSKVLDVGCGDGYFSKLLKQEIDCDITGTDICDAVETGMKFKLMKEDTALPFETRSFDIAIISGVLHHIPYEKQIQIIKEGLRVGRSVIVFEDHPTVTNNIICSIINRLHGSKIDVYHCGRTHQGWLNLFQENGIDCKVIPVKRGWWYPMTHMAYVLHLKSGV